MVVAGTAWIETGAAIRAPETTVHIFGDIELVTARSTEDCASGPFSDGPYRSQVVRALPVALVTRVPPFATVETDGDDVVFAVPVGTTGKTVDINAVDELVVDGT